eukprot:CAMPEP_0118685052 /NCGR_PEP_ID=MMETSP0800-20121206/7011_1 /TAXON_ID=210618 ORGANISM="Striatella unipunctata, Strain CCMP2910" /NCGR_SAMPLE_ID=MMETSP0800 /ASSEMBLY_ACC=CAM_ASM_000638 /LENGTH=466 /DNA_ID=CAMNT_0006581879 /DNA_START=61 /DNA_END=1458 /DNA_ORIENTATION=-
MTYCRLFQKVLHDDLVSYLYDANLAGANHRVSTLKSGFRMEISGYSEKLPFLLDAVTSRIFSLLQELKEGKPSLAGSFDKAWQNLLRQTRNSKLGSPHEVNLYNSRMLMEENAWYLDDYLAELDGELTMEECGQVIQDSLFGPVRIESLCIGNVDKAWALNVTDVIKSKFTQNSRPLGDNAIPKFKSFRLPTKSEAAAIFGSEVLNMSIPLVVQDVVVSESEDNNAIQVLLQTGSSIELGYEGVALFLLLSTMAHNSAFNQLRTKEQLGYLVRANIRKTSGGGWFFAVTVQSGVMDPAGLQDRVEAWLTSFREEMVTMSDERLASEASALVSQFSEKPKKLSEEIATTWAEIAVTLPFISADRNPEFDRMEKLTKYMELKDNDDADNTNEYAKTVSELRQALLDFFDEYLAVDSPTRRAVAVRCYGQKWKHLFEEKKGETGILSNYSEALHLKQFLSTLPISSYTW